MVRQCIGKAGGGVLQSQGVVDRTIQQDLAART
jgi:hypothetical protein